MRALRWACPTSGSPTSQQTGVSPRSLESRSMSCPAQLFNCSAFMPPVCTLTLERTSLPQVKTSVTAQAGAHAVEEDEEAKSDEYSDVMSQQMGSVLSYRHEKGINFADISDDLMVGSCLQTAEDVDRLAEEQAVGSIVNLQEDSDMAFFDLDLSPIRERCLARGDVAHNRYPIRDFDPFDLRMKLEGAVQLVADQVKALKGSGKKVYIHCTAGLGRAPATALAYMFWCRGFSLQAAMETLYAARPCCPRIQSIRQATVDLLSEGGRLTPVTISVSRPFLASTLQVAGLDVGWGQQIDLEWNSKLHRYETTRSLPPGRYPYKFIMDGRWTYSADHPTFTDGDHTNNYVEVAATSTDPAAVAMRDRVLSEEGQLTEKERDRLQAHFSN